MPITDGISARVIGWPRVEYLKLPQGYLFIDKGKLDGVALGDMWEVQRASGGIANNGTVLTTEPMALMQIVNVRDHSATGLLLNVKFATFPMGTPAVQVAKLPQ